MRSLALFFLIGLFVVLTGCTSAEKKSVALTVAQTTWPDTMLWWKKNNLRLMQTNLPAYEAALNPDSLLKDLQGFSANTLIINAGGIMAYYPTRLPFHYINPWMKENMLREVIEKCHAQDIRVIVRFDFSRLHRSIFEQHPDWCYISASGERIINDDMYLTTVNAPYLQEKAFEIIAEVMEMFPIDGIFLNMPGYHTSNAYEGKYYGIDQNEWDKKSFAAYSGGKKLPLKEDSTDPLFQQYQSFKIHTTDIWRKRLHELVKSKNRQIAICTYNDTYVDIIRHETQTNSLPYWPYMASDNVNNVESSYPNHIISNASIQQISFQSRYNAIEPEETAIRLYENIAHGSGLDISLMGDFRDYEDERNFATWREIYGLHKQFEPYFGKYESPAQIAVIAPGYWPGGEPMQEYRGVQLMLKEAHLQFDIIEDRQIGNLAEKMGKYRVIIFPEIVTLDSSSLQVIQTVCKNGTNLIATNRSFTGNPQALAELFGARAENPNHKGDGFYLAPENKTFFKRFTGQKLLFWKFNLGLYNFENAEEKHLPVYTPGRPGPPEKIGGHEPSGYFALGIKKHPQSKTALLPINLGKLYYLHGYEQHKNILLDVIENLSPGITDLLTTDAHERVEVILQNYTLNTPENLGETMPDGMILHLVNLTGFSGNTYFPPLPVSDLHFRIKTDRQPSRMFTMVSEKPLPFNWKDGYVEFTLPTLRSFEGVVWEW
ncbi:MAG: hypothetical protein SF052_20280 [Bacteroidia bacterium]|nr:hypothetical protein [Bacteroidia bacterium]